MGWIRVDTDMMGHPKIRRLATRLGCSKVQAIGHVIALWAWASKFSPHGSIDNFEPEEIADGAMWDGDAGKFIQAMKESELIDGNGILHDWQQYNGVLIEKRERDRERMQTLRKQSHDSSATVPLQSQGVAGTVRYGTVRTERNDTEQGEEGAEPPAAPAPVPPPVITLTTNKAEEFPITQEQADEFQRLYPAVDVEAQLREMRGWSISNKAKRKTWGGMLRFVNRWLAEEQDKAHPGRVIPLEKPKPKEKSTCPACSGKGEERVGLACAKCHGSGYLYTEVAP